MTFRRKCFFVWLVAVTTICGASVVADAQWMMPPGRTYWGVGRNWNPYNYPYRGYYAPRYSYGFRPGRWLPGRCYSPYNCGW